MATAPIATPTMATTQTTLTTAIHQRLHPDLSTTKSAESVFPETSLLAFNLRQVLPLTCDSTSMLLRFVHDDSLLCESSSNSGCFVVGDDPNVSKSDGVSVTVTIVKFDAQPVTMSLEPRPSMTTVVEERFPTIV